MTGYKRYRCISLYLSFSLYLSLLWYLHDKEKFIIPNSKNLLFLLDSKFAGCIFNEFWQNELFISFVSFSVHWNELPKKTVVKHYCKKITKEHSLDIEQKCLCNSIVQIGKGIYTNCVWEKVSWQILIDLKIFFSKNTFIKLYFVYVAIVYLLSELLDFFYKLHILKILISKRI